VEMLSESKLICEYQGIKRHIQVPVLCPRCNRRTFILDNRKEKGKCIRCGKEMTADELLEVAKADYLEKHSATDYQIRNNRGDCGNA